MLPTISETEPPQTKRSGRARIGCITLVTALFGVVMLLWTTRERDLTHEAMLSVDLSHWGGGGRFNVSIRTHWMPDGRLLLDKLKGKAVESREIYLFDPASNNRQLLAGFAKSRRAFSAEVVDIQSLSPDGKSFLCSARWGPLLLASVEGDRSIEIPDSDGDNYRYCAWLPDSSGWLETYGTNGVCHRALLRMVSEPLKPVVLTIKGKEEALGTAPVVLPDGTSAGLQIADLGPSFAYRVRLTNDGRITKITLALPPQSGEVLAKVSQVDGRIAWTVTHAPREYPDWATRLLPFLKRNQTITELWVSNFDGSNMHKLGSVVDVDHGTNDMPEQIRDVQWLPGGKKISFERGNMLYVVNVP